MLYWWNNENWLWSSCCWFCYYSVIIIMICVSTTKFVNTDTTVTGWTNARLANARLWRPRFDVITNSVKLKMNYVKSLCGNWAFVFNVINFYISCFFFPYWIIVLFTLLFYLLRWNKGFQIERILLCVGIKYIKRHFRWNAFIILEHYYSSSVDDRAAWSHRLR